MKIKLSWNSAHGQEEGGLELCGLHPKRKIFGFVGSVQDLSPDKAAAARSYLRVIDESGENYLFPGD